VRGNDGYNSAFRFGIGISIFGASNVNFQNVAVIGSTDGAAYGSAGTCLQNTGSSILLPVQFNLVASQFNDVASYIVWDLCAGIQISASNFVGNGTAISNHRPMSAMISSHQCKSIQQRHAKYLSSGTYRRVTLAGNTFYT